LDVAGDIGIGGYLRSVAGSNTNLNYIQLYDGNGGMNFVTYYGIGDPGTGNQNQGQGYFNFYTVTNGSPGNPAFTIRSNGNVGMGTTFPNATLTVSSGPTNYSPSLN
jgi:hypothetical protein